MISREEAINKLKQFWGADKFVFQADFHVPTNVSLREGSKPFGYFRNIRFNGEIIEYPLDTLATNERRISIYQILKKGLEDGKQYEVELELSKDEYRKKNPYSLIVQKFKSMEPKTNNIATALVKTINEIFLENININSPFQVVNLANSVESLATDIYSEDKRFIYELIQNADDAALDEDSELSIDILDKYVVISHNGAPFNSRDIRGLCSIGLGTKTNDATKTGYKGIGFKSVFGQPEGIVYVKTENTLFRFDREYARLKGWNSKWGNKQDWEEKNGVTFQCPWQMMPILSETANDKETDLILNNKIFSVKTAIKIDDSKKLYENINSSFGDAKFLLFLRRISRVELKFNSHKLELRKKKNSEIENIVTLHSNKENISNWYVKNWIHNIPLEIQKELKSDPKTPKKIQSMEKTEISFAININEKFDEIKLLEEGNSPLYSYLPTTEKEYNIPFIVNCNFILDASREKIHKNRKWNEWLFQVIGYKTVECSSEFAKNKLFEGTYLSLFRNGIISERDTLCKKINEGLKIGLDKFSIIRDRNNDLCKLKEIELDPFDLYKTDSRLPEVVASYLNETQKEVHLKGANLISLTEQNKVLRKLEANELKEIQLQEFFSSKHISNFITTSNNSNILSFLRPLDLNDPSGKWYTTITNNTLIINQEGDLDYIKRVCFPIDIETEEFKNTLIHKEVFRSIKQNEKLIEWLENLGVTDPGSIAYLEKEIIGRIDKCVNDENHLDVTKFIFKLHKDKKLTKTHYLNLQELPLKTSKGFKKANQTVLSLAFNPTIDFSKLLPNEPYLSEEYLPISNSQECRIFFKLINVTDDIEFIKSSKKLSTEMPVEYVKICNIYAKEGHTYPHLIGVFHPNSPTLMVSFFVQTFSFIEQIQNIKFAQVYWERLFSKYHFKKDHSGISPHNYSPGKNYTIYNLGAGLTISTLDEMNWGRQLNNLTKIPGFAFWHFDSISCIPTTGGLSLAKETFTNSEYNIALAGNYLPVINVNTTVPDDWCLILKLKTKFSINDLLIILEKISLSLKTNGFFDKENEKRLGLVYNELIQRLNIDSENTTETIKKWVTNHPIISTSKKNILSKNLLYINILGFENSTNGIETILIPKIVDTKAPSFEELLKAFGIKIINNFSYQAIDQKEFYDLKIKLLKLIGPICLMLKNRMIINNLNKSLYDRFLKVSQTKFIRCNNIRPVFVHDLEEIEGKIVIYYYDEVNSNFLISESWKNPSVILNISYHLSKILTAVILEKEIMMMLNMNDQQIVDYLSSLEINYEEYKSSKIAKDISSLTKELENTNSIKINEIETPPLSQNLTNNNQTEDTNQDNKTSNQEKTDSFWTRLNIDDENFIRGIIKGDYELNEQLDANTTAKIKTLMKIRDNYKSSEISDEGRYLKAGADEILVRSAQNGLLYLDLYHWKRLNENNVYLAIYTNNQIDIYETQDSLIQFTKSQNKFGILRLPVDYSLEDYNSLENINDKGKWHFVFIVNENTKAAQNYKEFINLDDYNF